jgi:hypothetical protein
MPRRNLFKRLEDTPEYYSFLQKMESDTHLSEAEQMEVANYRIEQDERDEANQRAKEEAIKWDHEQTFEAVKLLSLCPCGRMDRPIGKPICRLCLNEYKKRWADAHPLTEEQRVVMRARTRVHTYIKRGKLLPKPCHVCASIKSHPYHVDPKKPMEITWACRDHRPAPAPLLPVTARDLI